MTDATTDKTTFKNVFNMWSKLKSDDARISIAITAFTLLATMEELGELPPWTDTIVKDMWDRGLWLVAKE